MKKYLTIFFVCLLAMILSTGLAFGSTATNVKVNNSSYGTISHLTGNEKLVYPVPSSGYYFSHFENSTGKKVSAPSSHYNKLSIKVYGIKYQDYFLSQQESPYQYLTVAGYNQIVKEYVKLLYGTTSFTVTDTVLAYDVSGFKSLKAVFKTKKSPKVSLPKVIKANMKKAEIKTLQKKCQGYLCKFKSSNSRVLSIDKKSGEISLKSEGLSVVTVTVLETDTTKEKQFLVTVKVYPMQISITKLKPMAKSLKVSYGEDKYATGYKIALSKNADFSHKTVYTVNTPKTCSKVLKNLKKGSKYYVKVRAYKKSCGKYLYGKWSNSKSISLH